MLRCPAALVAALPEKTPATRAAGRRRAAVAATAPPAAAPTQVPSEHVQPVVLFDVTNDPVGAMIQWVLSRGRWVLLCLLWAQPSVAHIQLAQFADTNLLPHSAIAR